MSRVSDYRYGAAPTPAIVDTLRGKGKLSDVPIVLDSRYRMRQYSGVTAAHPTNPKSKRLSEFGFGQNRGQKALAAGEQIMSRMQLQSLVITCAGRDGMAAFNHKHKPVDIPIFGSDQVADVTGAGDTVIAAFTALAAGATTEEAAQVANYAGGIVVMKRGTATVSRDELLHAIEQTPPATQPH